MFSVSLSSPSSLSGLVTGEVPFIGEELPQGLLPPGDETATDARPPFSANPESELDEAYTALPA